jgi:hypothetical protein
MDGTVQVNITVRKYLWSEFVHDVCYVLYATIMISNALSKRFFHRSIPQLARGLYKILTWTFWIFMISLWTYLFIDGWLHPK